MSEKKRLAIFSREPRERIALHFADDFEIALVTQDPRALVEWAESRGIDAAALCEPGEGLPEQLELADILIEFGIDVFVLRPSVHKIVEQLGLVRKLVNGKPLLALPASPINATITRGKRACDVIFSTLIIVLGMPLWILIALAIALQDGKRVFFTQHRVRSGGGIFKMMRFRTQWRGRRPFRLLSMLNLEDPEHPELTPVGRLLKRVRLDECPQFWHALKGQISVVGPRPPLVSDVEWYQPWHRQRLAAWFGVTGLCQACGLTGEDRLDEIALYDILYLRNHSLKLDFKIALKTAGAIFRKREPVEQPKKLQSS